MNGDALKTYDETKITDLINRANTLKKRGFRFIKKNDGDGIGYCAPEDIYIYNNLSWEEFESKILRAEKELNEGCIFALIEHNIFK